MFMSRGMIYEKNNKLPWKWNYGLPVIKIPQKLLSSWIDIMNKKE